MKKILTAEIFINHSVNDLLILVFYRIKSGYELSNLRT